MNDYVKYDGLALAELVRGGEVSPVELLDASIERIERHNSTLNAVVQTQYERAKAVVAKPESIPDGPFKGVPFLVKALLHADGGVPMTNASRYFEHFVPEEDCELVARYKQAGLVICGRTNTPENGINAVTESALYGPSRNPWSPKHTPGGSSGGAAAAVASGMVPIANGSDGGGSIRIPASCCGLFGLKPSRMRTPAGPLSGDPWNGLASLHALSRSVRDSAAMLDATAGAQAGDPYAAPHPERPFLEEAMTEPGRMRIAFSSVPMFDYPIHAECITAMEDAARLCEELGHIVEERTPDYDRSALADAWLSIVAANEAADLVEGPIVVGRAPRRDELEPWTWLLSEFGAKKTASDVILALRTMHWEGRRIGFFFEDFDILLTPTLGKPPVAVGRISTATNDFGAFLDELMSFIPFTPLANAVGVPSASLPLYWNAEGLPIGVMLTGRFGDEASILRLSRQLETARPWNQRHPPIWD